MLSLPAHNLRVTKGIALPVRPRRSTKHSSRCTQQPKRATVQSFNQSDNASGPFRFTSLTELEVCAMANVRPNRTGLDMVIFVSSGLGVTHGPRIKISTLYGSKVPKDGSFFSVTVSEEPVVIGDTGDIRDRDVLKAKEFVRKNEQTLLAIWEQDVGVDEVVWVPVQ